MTKTQIHFRCDAEDRLIGSLTGIPGAPVDAACILASYEAEDGYVLDVKLVKDGIQLLCPRCRNPVVIDAGDEDVYAVPGALRFGEQKVHHGEPKREATQG